MQVQNSATTVETDTRQSSTTKTSSNTSRKLPFAPLINKTVTRHETVGHKTVRHKTVTHKTITVQVKKSATTVETDTRQSSITTTSPNTPPQLAVRAPKTVKPATKKIVKTVTRGWEDSHTS